MAMNRCFQRCGSSVAILALLGCVAADSTDGFDSVPPQAPLGDIEESAIPIAVHPPTLAEELAAAKTQWQARANDLQLRAAIATWEQALAAGQADLASTTLLLRAYVYLAEPDAEDDRRGADRVDPLRRALEVGEIALRMSSERYATARDKDLPIAQAIARIDDRGAEALYWYSTALLQLWSMRRIGGLGLERRDQLLLMMNRCLELEPHIARGGPYRNFGTYYSLAPGFAGGDLEKAKIHYKRALDYAPESVETKLLWAEIWAPRSRDSELFERLLLEVINTPDDATADFEPETQRAKRRAQDLLRRKAEFF